MYSSATECLKSLHHEHGFSATWPHRPESVENRPRRTGLRAWKTDLATEALEDADCRHARARKHRVSKAGDHQGGPGGHTPLERVPVSLLPGVVRFMHGALAGPAHLAALRARGCSAHSCQP